MPTSSAKYAKFSKFLVYVYLGHTGLHILPLSPSKLQLASMSGTDLILDLQEGGGIDQSPAERRSPEPLRNTLTLLPSQ